MGKNKADSQNQSGQHSIFGRIHSEPTKKIKLDIRDRKILSMLSEDARMPASFLAKSIRMSRDGTQYKIDRLIKNKIILGFIPKVNFNFFGYSTYHVFMIINAMNEEKKQKLIQMLMDHPNTVSLMEYHDTWDLEWTLIAKSIIDFDNIVTNVTMEFGDIIIRKDKLTIIKGFKSIQLPGTLYVDFKYKRPEKASAKIHWDEKDIALLSAMAIDARGTAQDLSEEAGMNAESVRYRITRLNDAGIVFGFTTVTNLSALGYSWYTFCINLRKMDISNEFKFRELCANSPFILRAVKVLGDWDLLIYLAADSSESFHSTFKQIQGNFMDIITDYQSWIAYKEHIYNPFPPVLNTAKN